MATGGAYALNTNFTKKNEMQIEYINPVSIYMMWLIKVEYLDYNIITTVQLYS